MYLGDSVSVCPCVAGPDPELASVTSAVGLVAVLKKWGLGGSVIVLCLGFVIGLSAVMVLVELVSSAVSGGGLNEGFSVAQLCGSD